MASVVWGKRCLVSCKRKWEKLRLLSFCVHESKLLTLLWIFYHPVQNTPSDVVIGLSSIFLVPPYPADEQRFNFSIDPVSLLHLSMVRAFQVSHKHLILSYSWKASSVPPFSQAILFATRYSIFNMKLKTAATGGRSSQKRHQGCLCWQQGIAQVCWLFGPAGNK